MRKGLALFALLTLPRSAWTSAGVGHWAPPTRALALLAGPVPAQWREEAASYLRVDTRDGCSNAFPWVNETMSAGYRQEIAEALGRLLAAGLQDPPSRVHRFDFAIERGEDRLAEALDAARDLETLAAAVPVVGRALIIYRNALGLRPQRLQTAYEGARERLYAARARAMEERIRAEAARLGSAPAEEEPPPALRPEHAILRFPLPSQGGTP